MPTTPLTPKDFFLLGEAHISFLLGEIDQGVHILLPGTVISTGEVRNEQFRTLCEMFEKIPSNTPAEQYAAAIEYWLLRDHGLDFNLPRRS